MVPISHRPFISGSQFSFNAKILENRFYNQLTLIENCLMNTNQIFDQHIQQQSTAALLGAVN